MLQSLPQYQEKQEAELIGFLGATVQGKIKSIKLIIEKATDSYYSENGIYGMDKYIPLPKQTS